MWRASVLVCIAAAVTLDYTLWAIKKRDTFIFSITQTNIERFS